MDDKKERKLKVIERTEDVEQQSEKTVKSHHTNPIMKKLAAFHLEKTSKFSVKDLFKR